MSLPIQGQPNYRPDVDGLRAVAVLAVIVFHYFPLALPGGFVGVDVFFVISGFLITGIITRDLRAGRFSLLAFWRRRILRIFPSLVTVLAVTLGLGCLYLTPLELTRLGRHVIAGAGFVSNFLLKSEDSYFDIAGEQKPLLHLWSLGIEEQFYILWPVVVAGLYRGRAQIKTITTFLLLASFTYGLLHLRRHATATFYLPTSRFWELLAGALLTMVTIRLTERRAHALSLAGLALIVASIFGLDGTSPFPGWRALGPVLGAVGVIAAGPSALINRHVLSWRPLVSIGMISFPLYLWHWPTLALPRLVLLEDPSVVARLGLLVLTTGLTLATYFGIERPIRFTNRARAAALGLIAAMMGLAAASFGIVRTDGFASRVKGPLAAYVRERKYGWDEAVRADACHLQNRELIAHEPECIESKRPLVMLWGDSHAAALSPGVRALQTTRDFGLIQTAQGACPPLLDLTRLRFRTNCNQVNQGVLEIFKTARPDVVILHSAWIDTRFPLPPGDLAGKIVDMVTALRTLQPAVDVVVVGPVPRWRVALSEVLIKNQLWGRTDPDARFGKDASIAGLDADLGAELGRAGIRYVSIYKAICPGDACVLRFGEDPDHILLRDTDHLTPAASRAVVNGLAAELLGKKVK